MQNIIIKNGKKFVKPARFPRKAYKQKSLEEVLEPYMKRSKKLKGGEK